MAGKFMKIKRIIIPMMTLIIMTSQLAGCATMSSNEMLETMQESPDVSIEYAIPDEEQQSLDATHILNIDNGGVVDSDSEGDIGLIDTQQEAKELSGAELLDYFQKVYDIHQEIHIATTLDGLINEELEFLVDLVESDGYTLPSDYEAQYRAWRPTDSLPADIQTGNETEQQSQQQPSGQQQGQQSSGQKQPGSQQTQQPSSGQQQQGQNQTSKPSGSTYDPYDGLGSYEAKVDDLCKKYPELSREEIMHRFPDPATSHIDEAAARADAAEDRLNVG
ncbi:hypothetical protein D1641_15065 [Colidextribacter sp. OB.20]|uniref:hypothetical protein n=1 Tax=Colidextribacter sp. OB.20 TaxID=2304568 RepID=UPI00136D9FFA|nr:hypothetical protein [Colidextribacter sp. OB.20]NBI11315.1 hypothetical protein [Colidextribacter sp. OB.20]